MAGYNHSIAVNHKGIVYTWGYSGFGILGREGVENIPLPLETCFETKKKFLVRFTKQPLALPHDEVHEKLAKTTHTQVNLSTKVDQVACVSLGTMVLTNKGEVFYCGDNRYGQQTKEEVKSANELKGKEDSQLFKQI